MFDRRTSQPAHHRRFFSAAISRLRSLVGSGLAALIFTQTAFGYQPQLSLWADRRAVAPAIAGSPAASRALLPDVVRSLKAPLQDPSALPLPAAFLRSVNVKTVRHGALPGVIVLLEDVHHNDEAQANISAALRSLAAEAGASPVHVALEGATGEFLFRTYQRIPAPIGDAVADAFFKSGEIGGPSHAGFVSRPAAGRRGLDFTGAEDPALYRRNVDAYRAAVRVRASVEASLRQAESALNRKKALILSRKLAAFDNASAGYRAGTVTMGDYATVLQAQSDSVSPVVKNFVEAWQTEQRLDFARVETERRQILESLVAKLSPHQIEALMRLSLGYRQGTVSFGRYYAELRIICEKAGVRIGETPAFAAYLRYVLLADQIDADALFAGIDEMEERVYERLISNGAEKALVEQGRRYRMIHGLIGFSMTARDWTRYVSMGSDGEFPHLPLFEAFYRSAEARNAALAAAAASSSDLSVLVAGGYHTAALVSRLSAAGHTVIVCSPRLIRADLSTASSYLSIFEREKSPLERLFSGKQIFLATPPTGTTHPMGGTPDALPVMAHVASAISEASTLTRSDRTDIRQAARALGDPTTIVGVQQKESGTIIDAESGDVVFQTRVEIKPTGAGILWRRVDQHSVGDKTVSTWSYLHPAKLLTNWYTRSTILVIAAIPLVIAVVRYAALGSAAVTPGLAASGVIVPMLVIFIFLISVARVVSDTPGVVLPAAKVFHVRDLSSGGRGIEPWLEGISKSDLVKADVNVLALSKQLFSPVLETRADAALHVAESPFVRKIAAYGIKGVNVTSARLAADLRSERLDLEVRSLLSEGVKDPKEIVRRLLSALAVISDGTLELSGVSSRHVRVSQETDMDLAVVEGAEDRVILDVARVSEPNRRIAARIGTWVFGRNGIERRGAVDRLIYTSALKGHIPQIVNDYGVHSYLLTVKAFLFGLHQRVRDLYEDELRRNVPEAAARRVVQDEVNRLSTSMNGVSGDELDRHPEFGFDALIDLGIHEKEADRAVKLGGQQPDADAADALDREILALRALKGKGGLAMTKVASEIHAYIFFGTPMHEREIEELFGSWMLPDIFDARGEVIRIHRDTGVVPFQQLMIGSEGMSGGNPIIRTSGLAGGWQSGTASRSAAYTEDELAQLEAFLTETGLPRREIVTEGIPAGTLSGRYMARAIIAPETVRRDPLEVLRGLNSLIRFLQVRGKLPKPVELSAWEHTRPVSISDVAEAVNEKAALSLSRARIDAERAAAEAIARVEISPTPTEDTRSARTLMNRILLIATFVAPVLIVSALSFLVDPGTAVWTVAALWSLGAIPFAVQAVHLALAMSGLRPWMGLIARALDFPRRDAAGHAGFSFGGSIYLNWGIMGRLSASQQASVISEEERHLRYQAKRLFNQSGLFERRSALAVAWEEWYVNVVMPIVDGFNALRARLSRTVAKGSDSDATARRWASQGRALARVATEKAKVIEALDAAAPRGRIFGRTGAMDLRINAVSGFIAAAPSRPALKRAHWAGFAAYRESIANRLVSVLSALNSALKTQGDGVVVFHLNQLGDPAILSEEMKELEVVVRKAEQKRTTGQRVSIIAAVSGDLPDDVAAHVRALMSRGGAVVTVGENLRLQEGAAYSYEELLRQAVRQTPGLDAARALLDGSYDNASFVTFSKIPAQFVADGRLREIWTLLANIGAGWTPIPIDTLMKTMILVGQNA